MSPKLRHLDDYSEWVARALTGVIIFRAGCPSYRMVRRGRSVLSMSALVFGRCPRHVSLTLDAGLVTEIGEVREVRHRATHVLRNSPLQAERIGVWHSWSNMGGA